MGLILRDINMSIENDIEALIGELTPEQIKSLMKDVKKPTIRRICSKAREKSMKVNDLYFSAEPSPYQFDGSWKEYDEHRDMIREQVIREVYND
jgi:hypothetical protein